MAIKEHDGKDVTHSGRRRRVTLSVSALALAMSFATACGSSSDSSSGSGGSSASVEKVALYTGSDRQAKLEAGAKKEGVLNLYTGPSAPVEQALIAAYNKKYPYVKVNVTSGDASSNARKVQQEVSAGKPNADLLDSSFGALTALQQANLLAKFKTPATADYPSGSYTDNFATGYQSYIGLGYNTKLIKPADAPKTLDDLLDPKWKNKMAIVDSDTGVRFVAMLELTKGQAFVDKLAQQGIAGQNVSGQALENLVVSGEVALSPTIYDSHVSVSKGKGAPIDWQPLEPVVALPQGPALVAEARHPNAAMLWIDFELSAEGQAIYQKYGYDSARNGAKSVTGQTFKTIYVDTRSDYQTKYPTWQSEMNAMVK